jgi:hypothetical protein
MKLEGWPEKLQAYTTSRRLMPYEWGFNDCVLFAMDGWMAIYGDDPVPELRGLWYDEAQAAHVLEAEGGLITGMDRRFKRVELGFAGRGDVVLLRDANQQPSLGLVVTAGYAAAPGLPGVDEMLLTRLDQARLAWSRE